MNLTRDLQNVLPKNRSPLSLIFFPNSKMGGNHGKMTLFPRRTRKGQAKKNLKERNCGSHVNNLGFWDIGVEKGRHTTLRFSLNMRKRKERKKHNLQPKKLGMKQQNKKNPLMR